MRFRLLVPSLLLASSLLANGPDFGGLGSGSYLESAGGALPATRIDARDSLDALLQDLPSPAPRVEEWYQEWRGKLPQEEADLADPLRGARKTFGGLFGEWAGTARRNQEVVLQVLGDLSPPDPSDPERTALLEEMLEALARHATDSRSSRGTRTVGHGKNRRRRAAKRPEGDADAVYAQLRALAEKGIGPESAGVLEEMHFTSYDFKAAAFVLLQHVSPRRERVEAEAVGILLENPPEPGSQGAASAAAILELAEETLGRAEDRDLDQRADLLQADISRIKKLLKRRQKASETLEEELGTVAVSSPHLMAAALRRRMEGGRPLDPALEDAFLELGRVDASLTRIRERLEMPLPEEVRLQEEAEAAGEEGDRGLFVRMDSTSLGNKISKELLDADLRLSQKLFDLDLAPGVSLSGKYKWELEGGERKDTWNRIDEWQLRAAVGIGDWVQEVFDLPFSIGVDHTRKILLVREFDSWKQAGRASLPKSPLSLPLNAEKARAMPMGHFWSLPVQMSAVASLGFGYGETFVHAKGYANYILTGRFRMNFFKESEDRVRVQFIGAREKGPGAGAEVKLGFDVLGISLLDKALGRLIDMKVLRWDRSWRQGLGVALDYVYDLDDPQAAAAFESAIRVSLGWGGMLATNPLIRARGMQDRLLNDLRPTERIFLEDREKAPEDRRVDRRFMATNQFRVRNKRFRIGPRLARYGTHSRWVENLLTVTEDDGGLERYQFPLYNYWRGWQVLFGLLKESGEIQAFSLMEAPEGRELPEGPQPLLLKAMHRDRKASSGEVEEIRSLVRRNLGDYLSDQLGLGQAPIPEGGKGFRSHILVALHPEATGKIFDPQQVSDEEVRAAAVRTVLAEDPDREAQDSRVLAAAEDLVEAFRLAREIPGVPGNEKQVRSMIRLAEIESWRSRGARFLLEMLGPSPSTQEVHIDVAWSGKGIEGFSRTYGSSRHEDLYLIVSEALSAVADRDRPFVH